MVRHALSSSKTDNQKADYTTSAGFPNQGMDAPIFPIKLPRHQIFTDLRKIERSVIRS